MFVVRLTAKAGPDGLLRLMVPVGEAGEYEVVVTAAPKGKGTPTKQAARDDDTDPLGWSLGENVGESSADPFFGDMDTGNKPDPLGGFS